MSDGLSAMPPSFWSPVEGDAEVAELGLLEVICGLFEVIGGLFEVEVFRPFSVTFLVNTGFFDTTGFGTSVGTPL